jgi:hypothetical protein
MNLHLSMFRPYQDRDVGHEDQLTRAALIAMRAVPLAHEAFLDLAAHRSVSELPSARFDMQTGDLNVAEEDVRETTEPVVDELVSVFLTPDESRAEQLEELDVDSARRARYDGVVRYGSRLLIIY